LKWKTSTGLLTVDVPGGIVGVFHGHAKQTGADTREGSDPQFAEGSFKGINTIVNV